MHRLALNAEAGDALLDRPLTQPNTALIQPHHSLNRALIGRLMQWLVLQAVAEAGGAAPAAAPCTVCVCVCVCVCDRAGTISKEEEEEAE
jgi:hypothetical protein